VLAACEWKILRLLELNPFLGVETLREMVGAPIAAHLYALVKLGFVEGAGDKVRITEKGLAVLKET